MSHITNQLRVSKKREKAIKKAQRINPNFKEMEAKCEALWELKVSLVDSNEQSDGKWEGGQPDSKATIYSGEQEYVPFGSYITEKLGITESIIIVPQEFDNVGDRAFHIEIRKPGEKVKIGHTREDKMDATVLTYLSDSLEFFNSKQNVHDKSTQNARVEAAIKATQAKITPRQI
ncbi:MAG: hypothetical protein LBM38_00960 [Clostridiales bacterium]|jgi:hypothetical protein|nr:hypothetical protein [Clostridiales bacterium]